MALTKAQKTQAVGEIVEILQNHPTVYLTNFSGLSVEGSTELRDTFRDAGVGFRVVKNTLLKLAMEQVGGFDELFDHLNGPTAIAYGIEPASPAKAIKKFTSDEDGALPTLKAAFIDGSVYGSDALGVLAALKSREELVGDVLGLLQAPMSNLLSALQAPSSNLVGALQTIAERGESA